MNAEPGKCPEKVEMTDSQIAAVIRSIAVNGGVTPRLYAVATWTACQMGPAHEGDHGGWVATLDDAEPETDARTCWLRWDKRRRQLAWLLDCPSDGCLLYQHHLGECIRVGDNDPERPSS